MALISRKQLKNNKQKDTLTEQEFLAKAEDYHPDINPDLSVLSIEELADQYVEIDRQSHLLKGKILLEARTRFQSDKEFGQWISTHSLCVGSQQARNRLMHLADFFNNEKDMTGISITAAYEISSPINKDKALSVYKKVHGQNFSVKEVKKFFDKKKVKNKHEEKINSKISSEVEDDTDAQELAVLLVDKIMLGKRDNFKIKVLNRAIAYIKKNTTQS
jgi:hypothetical protein